MMNIDMIKNEIDRMPAEMVNSVYKFIIEEEESNKSDKKEFYLDLLMNGPVIDNNELENIAKATETLNLWNIEKF